jgi:ABC-type cobalamin/Fe3+-siderophores transport system ATPase subunit
VKNLLQTESLRFSYGLRPVINAASVSLAAGEVVALLGPNGSGKSTLIKLLLGHLCGEGRIEWDGKPLAEWSKRDLARRVAYLPQSPRYEPEQTAGEILSLGRAPYWGPFGLESPRDAAVVRRVAERLALDEFLDRPVDELSGGQRQRVFIGRCLAQEPAALLLDEPSTFLDLRHQVELCGLLRQLAGEQSIGVLMASHDLNLAGAFADRLLLLHEGAVVADGPASDVLEPGLLSRVYGLPMDRIDRGGDVVVYPSRTRET